MQLEISCKAGESNCEEVELQNIGLEKNISVNLSSDNRELNNFEINNLTNYSCTIFWQTLPLQISKLQDYSYVNLFFRDLDLINNSQSNLSSKSILKIATIYPKNSFTISIFGEIKKIEPDHDLNLPFYLRLIADCLPDYSAIPTLSITAQPTMKSKQEVKGASDNIESSNFPSILYILVCVLGIIALIIFSKKIIQKLRRL